MRPTCQRRGRCAIAQPGVAKSVALGYPALRGAHFRDVGNLTLAVKGARKKMPQWEIRRDILLTRSRQSEASSVAASCVGVCNFVCNISGSHPLPTASRSASLARAFFLSLDSHSACSAQISAPLRWPWLSTHRRKKRRLANPRHGSSI